MAKGSGSGRRNTGTIGARTQSAFGRLRNRAGGFNTVLGRAQSNAGRVVAARRGRGLTASGRRRRPTTR